MRKWCVLLVFVFVLASTIAYWAPAEATVVNCYVAPTKWICEDGYYTYCDTTCCLDDVEGPLCVTVCEETGWEC